MTPQPNRRSFLTRTAIAGGFTLLPSLAQAAGSNSELRVAVIGLRSRGRQLIDLVLKAKDVRLVALCDVDPAILRERVDGLDRKNIKVASYSDYRTLCEAKDVDAVIVATPNHTHTLISVTAAANKKHVYVEKPVSHNVWEGKQLAAAQEAFGVTIQHGLQRRSETAWHDAFEWIAQGHIGEIKVARGICYKPRPSIGKVRGAQLAPEGLDYDLWCGPRPRSPIFRRQFHYDWHWQSPWGNGDIGNTGPHQLDVCRWALGDPDSMPRSVLSCGNRLGYADDGQWPNTQLATFDYEKAPILFEVRGLPSKGLDYKSGTDNYRGVEIGNIIEYEGGSLIGGHRSKCRIVDIHGKELKSFSGSKSPIQSWVDSIHSGTQAAGLSAKTGHLSSSLAHLANISWQLGRPSPNPDGIEDELTLEAFARMRQHLDANGIDLKQSPVRIGPLLTPEPSGDSFTGELKEVASPLLKGSYRKGFELPI
ncbi:Gfo/Idh/MocA family protein [Haloferula sp.]|uniref:Gfo/Idh/MocA family protein n=1 Tax=Haloferula sp. TaxID=2497595 RepID=UPI00329FB63F